MKITPAMLGRQAGLVARSVRLIAQQPDLGRGFGRLAATRGRSTMTLRLPWLPFRLIDELATRVQDGVRVFEYGGGGSTLWFLDRGATVVTVEHHREWAAALAASVPADRWTLLERPLDDDAVSYVDAIRDFPDDSFDIVVVDGRERARCVAAARSKVRPGGLLIVDDADRERYGAAIAAVPWPRRDVIGFAPAKPSLAFTAVLDRPLTDG